jgi:catechol 2,3-dioxygenase-like lactoylglutathione lyase family enzyme
VVLTKRNPTLLSTLPFCNLRYIIAQVMLRFSNVARGLEYTATLLSLCVVLQSALLALTREKQPERPHILGIDHVSVYVSDVEKSSQFYSEVLGLTTNCPQYAAPEPCYLVAPSDQRVFLKRAPTQTKNRTLKNWLAEVAFATDNLMGMRRYLLAHGTLPGIIQRDSDGSRSSPRPGGQSHCLRTKITGQNRIRACV